MDGGQLTLDGAMVQVAEAIRAGGICPVKVRVERFVGVDGKVLWSLTTISDGDDVHSTGETWREAIEGALSE